MASSLLCDNLQDIVFPLLTTVLVERVSVEGEAVRVTARTRDGSVLPCPSCGVPSGRLHSRYRRHVSDMAVGGRPVVIDLSVRRLFCDVADCPRRTFVEQVEGLTLRYSRYTPLLLEVLQAVGLALAGNAGARLLRVLPFVLSSTTVLSLLMALPIPAAVCPRVLGVDDFALRKGHRYGTILIDGESHQVIDVLCDRESETLMAWLMAHPGAEVICRDRASAYSRAATEAAPDAVQVADRWHLLHNLSDAVERTCRAHRSCLRPPVPDANGPTVGSQVELLPVIVAVAPETALVTRVQDRYAEVHRLTQARWTISAIARRLGLDRKTVRRYATTDLDYLIASARDRRPHQLEPYRPYLQQRFLAGCTNASQLSREITEHGYQGNAQAVRLYLRTLRGGTAPVEADQPTPSPRKITAWIMRPRDALTHQEQDQLDTVRIACPDIATTCDLARVFTGLVRDRRGHLLDNWIREAEKTGSSALQGFAGFLRHDWAAVTAGLTLPYSSGAVEGNVNRAKFLKRQTYGRAGFALLRQRILLA